MKGVFGRALLFWLLLIAVEVLHGMLRRLLLVPMIGDLPARQVGVFVGSALILALTTICFGWLRVTTTRGLLVIGAVWATLTFGFEVLFGIVTGASVERIASDYDLLHGGLMPIGLTLEWLSPYIASRLRAV